MIHLNEIDQARFHIGQKVQTCTGREAYICGVIYYSDLCQWHYALSFGAQACSPDEVWYPEKT